MPGPLDSTFFLDARVLKYSMAGMPFTPICPPPQLILPALVSLAFVENRVDFLYRLNEIWSLHIRHCVCI